MLTLSVYTNRNSALILTVTAAPQSYISYNQSGRVPIDEEDEDNMQLILQCRDIFIFIAG